MPAAPRQLFALPELLLRPPALPQVPGGGAASVGDARKQQILKQQRWLLFLRHCARCQVRSVFVQSMAAVDPRSAAAWAGGSCRHRLAGCCAAARTSRSSTRPALPPLLQPALQLPEGQCQYGRNCTVAKQLWQHLVHCKEANCEYAR